jgi:hypothetical protein
MTKTTLMILAVIFGTGACKKPISESSAKSESDANSQFGRKTPAKASVPVFSWTNSPLASKPVDYVAAEISAIQKCLAEARRSNTSTSCVASGAAGPGFYVAFDPFVSRNYGNTVVMLTIPKDYPITSVGEGYGWDRQENTSLQPILSEDVAISYPFSGATLNSSLSGNAIVLRGTPNLDSSQFLSVTLPQTGVPFSKHKSFVCTNSTPIADILKNWGDHMEFLHVAFLQSKAVFDPATAARYAPWAIYSEGKLTRLGAFYAAISDAAAAGRITKAAVEKVKNKLEGVGMSLASCRGTSSLATSDRDCLMAALGSSLGAAMVYRNGRALSPADSSAVLKELGVAGADNATSSDTIRDGILPQYLDAAVGARLKEAFDCGRSIKTQLESASFETWGL